MDPRTRLDYALFQLTPTRTRCDLVIFSGGENEKLASGLFQPFVSHLKSARDQISRGGYSVTLRSSSSSASPWFTKSTLQRFVRFVSTPEVLERLVTLEKEIEQIEDSIQSNGAVIAGEAEGNEAAWSFHKSMGLTVAKSESEVDTVEENSKVRLQRVLESRKAVLCKEQAMAYARALVVGFELEYMDDLLAFADAFGASRLREACMNFMDLCKRKNEDRLWVDQIAAMQALPRPELSFMENSGIILAGEENDMMNAQAVKHGSMDASSQGSLETNQGTQMAMPWLNPQYMQNFQGHTYPNAPPFHGYMYPGMQGPPPYMQWPVNMGDSEPGEYTTRRSSKKMKKKKKKSKHDESTDPSDSSDESESEEENHGKKSSKKVVIRNINYITSKRNGGKGSDSEDSDEEGFIDGDSIKQQVEEAVGSLERRRKSSSRRQKKHESSDHHGDDSLDVVSSKGAKGNDNWDAFQNLLLKDKDSEHFELEPLPVEESNQFSMESEVVRKRQYPSDDSLLLVNGDTEKSDETHVENFEAGENVRPMKRENAYEDMLFSERTADSGNYSEVNMSEYAGPRMIRSQTEGDWFLHNQADSLANQEDGSSLFVGDQHLVKKNEKDVVTDDSFMIQSLVRDQSEYQSRTEFMVSDIVGIAQQENSTVETMHNKPVTATHEPDDLFMVLGREPGAEPVTVSWSPEIDYENDILANEVSKIKGETGTKAYTDEQTSDGKAKKNTTSRGKVTSKDSKSRASNRPDPTSKAQRPPWGSRAAVPKSKSEREEERRKRMEELLTQRQKRIAERSGGNGSSSLTSKKTHTTTKTVNKDDKKTTGPAQAKPKPVLRSSTIERLSVARTAPKEPPAQSKSTQQKPSIKRTSAVSKPMANKTDKTREKKLSSDKTATPGKKDKSGSMSPGLSREPSADISENMVYYDAKFLSVYPEKQTNEQHAPDNEFKDIKELNSVHSPETTKEIRGSHDNDSNVMNSDVKPVEDQSKAQSQMIVDHEADKTSMPICEDKQITKENESEDVAEVRFPTKLASPKKSVTFSETNMEEKYYLSPRVSEINIMTPPSESIRADQSRKKWNSEATSPKATAKVFRKLLMFGRKSRS